MTLRSVGVFLPALLTGFLLVHWLWGEKTWKALLLQAILGIGFGLGLSSLLDFLYMLVFSNENGFLFLQIVILLAVLGAVFFRERQNLHFDLPRWRPGPWQISLLGGLTIVMVFSALVSILIWGREPHGAWDAWMMFNRTARFIYRDQPNWLQSFSHQMDPLFHPDYPLQVGLNVAWAWQAVGTETQRVPIVLSGLFLLGCAGLFGAALTLTKSALQAGIGLIFLLGSSFLSREGALQLADVPLLFFLLATIVLIYLYASAEKPALLILAGFSAGLAAWTKNEGSLFVAASLPALVIGFSRRGPWRVLGWYALGLAFPLTIVMYFKLFLSPPTDVLSNGMTRDLQAALDVSRHLFILKYAGTALLTFGDWGIGVLPILIAYALIFKLVPAPELRPAYLTIGMILAVQALGYYALYVITPYDLQWHLNYSLDRVMFHIYLPLLFLFFATVTDAAKALAVQ